MYSLVLMMALGNGAATPSVNAIEQPEQLSYATHNHTLYRGRGCHGCHGCWGCHCYGCYCYGCYCYGCYCYGCYGCWGCHCYGGYAYGGYGGSGSYGYGTYAAASTEAPATITVNLPADAKLTVDDHPTQSTTDRRTFVSPPLQRGKEYCYTLKAEINRDGKSVAATQTVTVQAGKESQVRFDFGNTTAVALK